MSALTLIRKKIDTRDTCVVGYCTRCKKLFFLDWEYPAWSKCTCTMSAICKHGTTIYVGGKCIPMLFSRADIQKLKDYGVHGIRMKLIGQNNIERVGCIRHMWLNSQCNSECE